MDISLVIPAHNEASCIGKTLDTAISNSREVFKEVIVVDNASTDKTAEIAQAHGARVVREERKGLPYARQAGFNATTSEWIAYIDADTLITPQWIGIAEKVLGRHPNAVSLSGPRRYFGTAAWRRRVLNAMWITAPIAYAITGYMILGGNFIVKRSAIEKTGGFDTSVEFYGEDTNLARRLSLVGKTLFRMDFYVYASARRFEEEGVLKPNITYMMNYIWPALFGRPYSRHYHDVR